MVYESKTIPFNKLEMKRYKTIFWVGIILLATIGISVGIYSGFFLKIYNEILSLVNRTEYFFTNLRDKFYF